MKEYKIEKSFPVIGFPVKTFPEGIETAFRELMNNLPGGDNRVYYGIGECSAAGIVYIAAAEQLAQDEAQNFGLESYKIESGKYLAVEILDWKPKTASIKDVFELMYQHKKADRSKPSIEIYLNDNRMLCLVKELETKAELTEESREKNNLT
jgi:predicted transcriptional regulator YdeE